MDNKYSLLELRTNKLVDSLFVGNYKTKFKSKGIEFADFREYSDGDDAKNIDWLQSCKEGKTLVKLYEEERELSVYFLIDCEESINFKLDGISKRDLIEEFLYMIGLSAIKGGDKLGAFFFNDKKIETFFAKKGRGSLINILSKFESFISDTSFLKALKRKNGLEYFNSLKLNKSLVFLITSRLNLDEKQLKILALKHDLVVVNVFHSFENDLNSQGIKRLFSGNESLIIDVDNKNKKQEYVDLRKSKLESFKAKVRRYGGDYLYVDEKIHLYSSLLNFMKNRS